METSICNHCKQEYFEKPWYSKQGEQKKRKHQFCCRQCRLDYFNTKFIANCKTCNVEIERHGSDKSKSGFYFCSSRCSASYNNQIRQKKRRSKMEKALFDLLVTAFPKLEIIANDRKTLNGLEIDIFIPKLQLAIEWNGIVHFKPIFGEEKLLAVQEKDRQKLQIANEKNIRLIVIPDYRSNYSLVKEAFSKIKEIIENLSNTCGEN